MDSVHLQLFRTVGPIAECPAEPKTMRRINTGEILNRHGNTGSCNHEKCREILFLWRPVPIILVGMGDGANGGRWTGRVLIPEELREISGLQTGTVVAVEKQEDRIIIKPVRKSRRAWKQMCGLVPLRTGKPQWPTPEEIKSIWQ